MKKQKAVVKQFRSFPFSLSFKSSLTLIGAACAVWIAFFLLRGNISAQSSVIELRGGQSMTLKCDGLRFRIIRHHHKVHELRCLPSADEPPIAPIIVPTEPPVQPTEAPPPTVMPILPPEAGAGARFYVSKLGSNGDGRSWQTAWNELDQVDWSQFEPGDTLLIDGGESEMVYRQTLTPTQSGTAEKPIRIQLATEQGRNGQAIIFGGRETPLPYCDQRNYSYNKNGLTRYGALFHDVSWIELDGTKWQGIVIHGMASDGIRLYPNTSNLTFRHMEIYDNGNIVENNGRFHSDGKGLRLEGANHLVERTIIHDNGQDAIQSNGAGVSNFTIRQSWFYNSRPHPHIDQSFNYCMHSDALQIFNGGRVSGVTIEQSVMGPGFTNTILLGDSTVDVNDVLIRDVLILKGAENNISAHSKATTSVRNWRIENVTVFGPDTAYNAITYKGVDLTIHNSLFVGSHINIPNTSPNMRNNCQWNTTGIDIGAETNVSFADAKLLPFDLGNYRITGGSCAGVGSSIHSVEQLMALPPVE